MKVIENRVFMTKVNPNNEIKQNPIFSHGTHSNVISFFIGCKILNYFNGFYNWHFLISLQK